MAKLRRIFQGLIVGLLVWGLNTAPLAASAGQPAAPQEGTGGVQETRGIPDSYELLGENDLFQLYADPNTLGFKVLDKRSGYTWHSSLDEVTPEDRLNKTWTAFAVSGISVEYLDAKAVSKRVSITNSTTSIDFQTLDQGFSAAVEFTEYGISVTVIVQLEPNGVSVQVPFEAIVQASPEYKLGKLYVYPFFAATLEDQVPGYMFLPDGSGSLVRFAETTKAKNMFYGRYYGQDLGMIVALPYDDMTRRAYTISLPVFGMVHGEMQNAFLSIVEKGAAYGELQAHPAGITTRFNFLYSAFVYNESYFQATNRAGAGVTTLQPNTNAFDVLIHYRFLTGEQADYVGMAKSYQQYLVGRGDLAKVADPESDIGIKLEFLAGDKQKVLFWQRFIPMTTIAQVSSILEDLAVGNPEVVYYGWQPLGASSMPPSRLKIERTLGSMSQLRALIDEVKAGGGNFYLYLDPQAAIRDEQGYSPRNDLAMSITNFNLVGYHRNKVNYYLNYETLSQRYASLHDDVAAELQAGLALDQIGSMLYSDFKSNHVLNREEAIHQYQELLRGNAGGTAFYLPNDYMFAQMQAYYDMPLGNSGYIYTTEAVPFLQIVLAGYVPYYGPALNFSSNLQDDLLKHVDYGVYPSYFLTNEVTAKILETRSNWIYSSSIGQWSQEVEQTYQWLNSLLGPVKGQEITARQVLAEGVFATTYGNGKLIIVNYTNKPFSHHGVVVNGRDAVISEVLP